MISFKRAMIKYYCRHSIELWLLYTVIIGCCLARGPHHPKSEVNKNRAEQQKHINEHLALETQHLQEDLEEYLPNKGKVEELSEEEKSYLYFKVHDLDGNEKLDGLEIFYSATHHSQNQHERQDEPGEAESQAEQKSQSNESDSVDLSLPNMKLLKLDENGQMIDESFNHVVDVLDNFLAIADLDNDGYLNYAEYAAAIKVGQAVIDDGQKAEL